MISGVVTTSSRDGLMSSHYSDIGKAVRRGVILISCLSLRVRCHDILHYSDSVGGLTVSLGLKEILDGHSSCVDI